MIAHYILLIIVLTLIIFASIETYRNMNRDSKDVWIETEDRVNWSEIENFYDIKEFEPPELVFCKRCKQVFVSYDMFYEHRKAVGMDVRGDEKRLKDGEYIHSLHYGYKLGYENCESKQ